MLFISDICTENFCVFTHLFSVAKKQGPDFVLKNSSEICKMRGGEISMKCAYFIDIV